MAVFGTVAHGLFCSDLTGAPTLISYPHFFLTDPKALEPFEGLHPDPEKHDMFADIHPVRLSPSLVASGRGVQSGCARRAGNPSCSVAATHNAGNLFQRLGMTLMGRSRLQLNLRVTKDLPHLRKGLVLPVAWFAQVSVQGC